METRNSNAYRFISPGTITYFDTLAAAEAYAITMDKPKYRIESWTPTAWVIREMKPGNWAAHVTS